MEENRSIPRTIGGDDLAAYQLIATAAGWWRHLPAPGLPTKPVFPRRKAFPNGVLGHVEN
jgi:hypothetical protein